MKGKIKKLNDKGFGFITPEGEGQKDFFFHRSGLQGVEFNELQEGDNVTFDTEEDKTGKGPRAINVVVG